MRTFNIPGLVLLGILSGVVFVAMGCDDNDDFIYPDPIGDDDEYECSAPITDVDIRPHPDNTLAFYASWKTPELGLSRIEFGIDGYQFYLEDDSPTTNHEVFVYGMKPLTEYSFIAVSLGADDVYCSEEQYHTTGTTPFADVDVQLAVHDKELAHHGWTLANFMTGGQGGDLNFVMWDMDGDPVWYYHIGHSDGRGDSEVSVVETDDGPHVVIGGGLPDGAHAVEIDMEGNVRWEGPMQPDGIATVDQMHHCFHKTSNGNYVGLFHDFDNSLYSNVYEIDPDLNVVWEWNLQDYTDWDDYDMGNWAVVDYEENVVYYNENISKGLYKIDRDTKEVIWKLGHEEDFVVTREGGNDFWLNFTHAPKMLSGGHILFYDNGDWDDRSRALELVIDEDAMTAEVVWEYDGGGEYTWFNYAWGDADRLPNGNTLITAGTPDPTVGPARIIEVTPDGEEVWRLEEYDGDEQALGSYMSERIEVLVGEFDR